MTKIRSAGGDLLAQRAVGVSKDDLIRLQSMLNLLVVNLKDATNPADRGNVGTLLKKVKEAVVLGAAGEKVEFNEETQLADVITSLPLKTDVLKTSVQAIAQMDEDSFKQWISNMQGAAQRTKEHLEKPADQWTELSKLAANQKYLFILLQDMP